MKPSFAVAAKCARLSNPQARPRVLDLFAGCGGLSLGFRAAGCEVVAALEIDELAARSHAINFFKGAPKETMEHHAKPRDVASLEPEDLVAEFGLGKTAEAIDIIVGGPPCQAYARVGRAKLREVADHPRAFKVDPRGNLYLRYLHYVDRLKPLAILFENVPDILNYGGHNVVQEIVEALDAMGYKAAYSLINAAHHGVPQMRDRVYMIAYRKELDAAIRFPHATHNCILPPGYAGTRAVSLKLINAAEVNAFIKPDTGHKGLPHAVTAREALGDLPAVTDHLEGKLKRGARRFTEAVHYRRTAWENLSSYAQVMRSWPGFEARDGIYDHVLRYLPRDSRIFKAMMPGDEYPAAHRVALQLFQAAARRRGLSPSSAGWKSLHDSMVPPYDATKFPNRWWKLKANEPVRTLTAHIGKDTYTHIHYDSDQARVITVREAARLQSFPDGFVFAGTMNPAFRQIGNAVPPILARELAVELVSGLRTALFPVKIAAE
ncbi:DNA cytosine methyltransferase [Bradyrhizobium liaoningense]|uniref:DNA cytosine methyltransferase n=1 Tax=Bradyrhizobium liaoningense TaxID=43992 RepID=UPI001BA7B273|nr:DNA cytosine methyltransferase [Bradyrhizobium liaoningense]MBR1169697.1 DNA cytosine methyltransferase [Bradyrhizobium liaoningense]